MTDPCITMDAPQAPAPAHAGAGAGGALGRVLRIVANVALALVVLATLALAIGPRTGAYRTITILSGSMVPTYAPGDVIVSTPIHASDVRVGDVITFHAPIAGSPIVSHRVVQVVHGGAHPVLRTKGDANPSADPWTARVTEPIVWRQRGVIPHLGSVIHALRAPALGHGLLYGSLACFLLVGLHAVWTSGGGDDADEPTSLEDDRDLGFA
jgi:signal peptidase